ncbi:MAG: bifunctional hydroxymethylpyrimidine kinase/phosphomethylpyrimidine kinase, partial [Rhizobiaceae bacterium]
IKIGMVANAEIASAIAETLRRFGRKAVLDPVMVATSGDRLLEREAVDAIRRELLPLAIVATPNLPEAAILAGSEIARSEEEMERQALRILDAGAEGVLVKGGHGHGAEAVDLLLDSAGIRRFSAPRIDTRNDHGTGCTLSAAIAAGLAKGDTLEQAVAAAKTYLSEALAASTRLAIGHGRGPVHHFHRQW